MCGFGGSRSFEKGRLVYNVPSQLAALFLIALTIACSGADRPAEPGSEANPTPEQTEMRWDAEATSNWLTISADGLTVSWDSGEEAAWLPAQSTGRLTGGIFTWDFEIEALLGGQMGVKAADSQNALLMRWRRTVSGRAFVGSVFFVSVSMLGMV